MPKPASLDLERLVEIRDYHVRQATRIDTAIDVLREAMKPELAQPPSLRPVRARRGAKATKARPEKATDLVRQAFVAAGDRAMDTADLLAVTGLEAMGYKSGGGGNGARRVLGVALSALLRRKEIKKTREGFVARKLAAVQASSRNGAPAPA